jgi:hypothetical protein
MHFVRVGIATVAAALLATSLVSAAPTSAVRLYIEAIDANSLSKPNGASDDYAVDNAVLDFRGLLLFLSRLSFLSFL